MKPELVLDPLIVDSGDVSVRFTGIERDFLRTILREYAQSMRAVARELDVKTHPLDNAGRIPRRYAIEARRLRAKLKP